MSMFGSTSGHEEETIRVCPKSHKGREQTARAANPPILSAPFHNYAHIFWVLAATVNALPALAVGFSWQGPRPPQTAL